MEKTFWKTLAIILIFIIIIETLAFAYIIYLGTKEINNEYECLYTICGEYPQAFYDDLVCSCYDYDIMGNLQVIKTEYMG